MSLARGKRGADWSQNGAQEAFYQVGAYSVLDLVHCQAQSVCLSAGLILHIKRSNTKVKGDAK